MSDEYRTCYRCGVTDATVLRSKLGSRFDICKRCNEFLCKHLVPLDAATTNNNPQAGDDR